MILNGYDTIVGSKFKRTDNIDSTLKTLSTTNRLPLLSDQGVYGVDYENGESIPSFVFPITVTNYKGQIITVFDQRHYMNSKGNITNTEEYGMMYAASVLQQQVAKGKRGLLNSCEHYTVKAFSKAVSNLLAPQSNLNASQKIELEIILAHYFVCLISNKDDDYEFISQNVIKKALKYSPMTTQPIIETLGYLDSLSDLVTALKENERLPTLAKLDTGAFVAIINRTWFVSSGFKMIMGAAAELPHLFTAICYASVTNNMYKKTGVGRVLDRKETPDIDSFVNIINAGIH